MTHADGSASMMKRCSSTQLSTRPAAPPVPEPAAVSVLAAVPAPVPASAVLEAGGEGGEGGEGGSRHTRCCSLARRMSSTMSSRQTAPPLPKVKGSDV